MTKPRSSDERAPAFQFYWKQWLSDDKVMAMSWDARGMHMHYICLAWQQSPPCTLPDDDEILQAWVGFPVNWETLKRQIFRAWRRDETTGRLVQDGLLRVWEAQQAYRDSRRRNAQSGHEIPSDSSLEDAKAYAPACAGHVGVHTALSPSPTPSPKRTTRKSKAVDSESKSSDEASAILAHYLTRHPRRRIGPKDRKAVAKALTLGYTAVDLCAAIDGNASDDWHREKHKHELPYVLRDTGNIDNFRARSEPPAVQRPPAVDEYGVMADWFERATRPT